MNGNKSLIMRTAGSPVRRAPAWGGALARRLLQHAAHRVPGALGERLAEEWLADLAQQRGALAYWGFVGGCWWAAIIIAQEAPPGDPAPIAATPVRAIARPVPRPPGRRAGRALRALAERDNVMSEINITPLIDVMLVLLVTLIISLPTMTHAVKLRLPGQPLQVQASTPAAVDLDIESDGTIVWNGTVLAGLQQLEGYFQAEAQRDPQAEIHLRPERRARYDVVAKVLASAQRNHLEKMAFANTTQFAN
jgi:biopolymer transport protein ExbD